MISFETRLSDWKKPSGSDDSVTSFQNSWSDSRDGIPCAAVCDESDYRLGGSFFDGKGQPGQVSAVSHGSSTARFNGINVINTARNLG